MKTYIAITISVAFSPFAHSAVLAGDAVDVGTGNVVPSLSYSIASGTGNSVAGASLALGDQNEASNYSAAVGGENTAENYSMVAGYQNFTINGGANLVGGWSNELTGVDMSLVAGFDNTLIGGNSIVVLGSANYLNLSAEGIVMGGSNLLNGAIGSIILGEENEANVGYSWIIGKGNIGQTETVVVGSYNSPVSNSAFIVGNGTNISNRSNALIVSKGGAVEIPGLLTKGGSPVLSQVDMNSARYMTKLSSGALLESEGYLALGAGAEAEDFSASMGRDAVAGAENSFAFGDDAEALQEGGMALMGGWAGGNDSLATHWGMTLGDNSIALGGLDALWNNLEETSFAQGDNSTAIGGVGSKAVGFSSFSSGYWTEAKAAYSVAIGSLNIAPSASSSGWVETDPLFELGNGWAARGSTEPSATVRSNAVMTLKNGHTTITNKAWKAHVASMGNPLEDPSSATTDSGGEALLIEGHAHIKGRLTLDKPQGDLSMGIYD